MFIKEFENDVGFALILEGNSISSVDLLQSTSSDTNTVIRNAALIIELYPTSFNVIKDRYSRDFGYRSLPLFLLDDYIEHFSKKYTHNSPILKHFKLYNK